MRRFVLGLFLVIASLGCAGGDGGSDGGEGSLDASAPGFAGIGGVSGGGAGGSGGSGGNAGNAGNGGTAGSAGTSAGQSGAAGAAGFTGGRAGEAGEAGAAPPDPEWIPPPPPLRSEAECGGFVLSCASLGDSACIGTAGCSLEGDCRGVSRLCSTQRSHGLCIDVDGCVWNNAADRCSGSSWSCSLYSGSGSCVSQPGCSWSRTCEGSATECEALSAATCGAQDGCALECAAGTLLCGSTCVDPLDDEQHCGACDFDCGPRGSCTGGVCECGAPYEVCAGKCTNTSSDLRNCGACGHSCGGNFTCEGGVCQDIDECASNRCTGGRACTNTDGGFSCGPCPAGFMASGPTGCADIDECATNNGGCDPAAPCINSSGGHSCGACPSGYTGSGATECVDLDECDAEPCDALTSCFNEPGGFYCSGCPSGYSGTGLAGCEDIDECADFACDARTTCTNSPGGYACTACPAGFDGDGYVGCTDIDECSTANGGCAALRACVNSAGSHTCGDCQAGYRVDGPTGCSDIDECVTDNGGCHAARVCTNTIGSSTCGTCGAGYTNSGARNCTDINECNTNNGGCGGSCVNFGGGYRCACPVGSRLQPDGVTCYTPAWRIVTTVESVESSLSASYLDLAMHGGGTAIVAYSREGELRVARRAPFGPWAAQSAAQGDGAWSHWPEIAVNNAGDAAVVWGATLPEGVTSNLHGRHFDASTGWEAARPVEHATTSATNALVALDANSVAHALWSQNGGVWFASAAQGVSWPASPAQIDADAPGYAIALRLRPDGSGFAAWRGGSPQALYVRTRSSTGIWGASQRVVEVGTDLSWADAVLGPSGEIMLVYGQSTALRAVRFDPLSGWQPPAAIQTSGTVYQEHASLGADAAGNYIAVWAASSLTIYASRYTPAQGWSSPTTLASHAAGYFDDVKVAVAPSGEAIALYIESLNGERVWVRRFLSSGWRTATNISLGIVGDFDFANVAIADNGDAMAVWERRDQLNGVFTASILASALE